MFWICLFVAAVCPLNAGVDEMESENISNTDYEEILGNCNSNDNKTQFMFDKYYKSCAEKPDSDNAIIISFS